MLLYTQLKEYPNIVLITPKMIDDSRLEAVYYKKEYLDIDERLILNKQFRVEHLKELCSKITDGTHKTPRYVSKEEKDSIVFVSSKNVTEEEIDFSDVKYITKEEHLDISKRCKVETGDILLTKIGRIGFAKVVPQKHKDFSIFVSVALLKIHR